MKLVAIPAEINARINIPTATVHTHTVTPVGTSVVGRRQPRDNNHPPAAPDRNGHAVSAIPATVRPSA
jgi:hypothetical protein